MWHNTVPEIRVIEHGVPLSPVEYSGELNKGIVVVNNLKQRGRKLGYDIFKEVAKHVPLDLIGMGTIESGGLGEILHPELPQFIRHYRFFFNPIRYTSMGLAVCEAMSIGVPIVALATTENAAVFKNGYNGFTHTDIDYLIDKMLLLIQNPELAKSIGQHGKELAQTRFSLARFTEEWKETFLTAINNNTHEYDQQNSLY
jgi:glycosyltransferase involved in cell wall biosynthesis